MRRFEKSILLLVLGLSLAGCSQPGEATPMPTARRELTVMTHDSFDVSAEVVAAFEEANQAKVTFIAGGDAGTALNKLILAKDNPPADIFYGLDNTFLSRAIEEDLFIPYQSPVLADIPDEYKLDPEWRVLPVDYGDVCLNYDKAYFNEKGLNPPQSLEDLALPPYRSLLVVENPATSSPGLAFLMATIAHFGEDGYLDYWESLRTNDVKVVNDWESAYYTEFSRYDGTRPIVVSYGSSPPFEVIFAETPLEDAPTAAVTAAGSCFRQVEFAGILRGAKNVELAQKWVDFMLSPLFQEDMPLKMFVFPVNPNAELDEEFQKYLAVPEQPASLDPALIAKNRESWIRAWTETVLR